ncbi:hypothetical protein [Mycobacterium sp. ITM-2016-00318]|uniref:hypothetical protein n=1 Tax=Mycobacterium sp. ITM-2016-00318 TaxID=2099693 RepID=UPI000CF8A019|nr:hypothetical protein [Mycobacterium sp. ITM-2016-00318]WNG93815.1 hypothetical protein C6A82_004985 [Mycobacterium sp. ITM-2016-00318]
MNTPDADALAILLPSGNGNATQINILEGNVFNPQFGAGGNSSITQTIGNIIFGQGNHSSSQGSSGGGIFGPIALGGASGNGNVTQINILSFNIINPQLSLNGTNNSHNTTISNVAVGNGNFSNNNSSASGGSSMIGGAVGNGNTRQLALFSGNIFNPQFSFFGDNISNNTAISNVSLFNGNFSNNSSTGDGGAGSGFLGALLGNGNTNQTAAGVSNIINPQFSFLGKNWSNNNATTNLSGGNGNFSNNQGSTSGNNGTVGGANGNGNTAQTAYSAGNNINEQLRLGTWFPGMPLPAPPPDAVNSGDVVAQGTNATNTWLPGVSVNVPAPVDELILQGNTVVGGTNASVAGANTSSTAGNTNRPRPLRNIVSQVRGAVERAADGVNNALGIAKPATSGSQTTNQPASSDAPSNDSPSGG